MACGPSVWLVTLVPVVFGAMLGLELRANVASNPGDRAADWLGACSQFDGLHYASICRDGYAYNPNERSSVAFFPLYPVLARGVVELTGLSAVASLLVVSNGMLLGSFVLLALLLRRRPGFECKDQALALLLFGLWPPMFFSRMCYSESTFLFCLLLFLVGVDRRWPALVIALSAGAATAARPVGVAVAVAAVFHILTDAGRGPLARRGIAAAVCTPIAAWGVLSYMAYQDARFDTPLAFAQTQSNWSDGVQVRGDPTAKVDGLLAGEPIWGAYRPGSLNHWSRVDSQNNPLVSMPFWNPAFFVLAVVLVLTGALANWLTATEVVLGAGLLAIPYVTRAYEMSMGSHARFSAVVVPAYFVLVRLLRRAPDWATIGVLVWAGATSMMWSALFAAGRPFF